MERCSFFLGTLGTQGRQERKGAREARNEIISILIVECYIENLSGISEIVRYSWAAWRNIIQFNSAIKSTTTTTATTKITTSKNTATTTKTTTKISRLWLTQFGTHS